MSVHQFGRETDCIRCYGGKSVLINLSRAVRRYLYLKTEGPPEGAPERHRLPVGKHLRQSDGHIFLLLQLLIRIILHQELLPQSKEIRHLLFLLLFLLKHPPDVAVLRVAENLAPLTAVVGNPGIAVGKTDNGTFTMVAAERTRRVGFLGVGEIIQLAKTHESPSPIACPESLFCKESRSDGSHDARIWRADYLSADVLFHGPQYRVVKKCTALHHDLISEALYIFYTNYFCKYIFYDGTAETGHDIRRLLAVSLLCDDTAVHKNRAAAAEHRRILRRKGGFRNLLHRNMQGGSEVLQERTTSGRTCFIDHNVSDDAVIQPYGLHILSADIQNKRRVGHIFLRCAGMGHGLHHVTLQIKRLGKQELSVTGGSGGDNVKLYPGLPVTLPHGDQRIFRHQKRISLIGGVERIQNVFIFIHQHKLCGCASGINAQIGVDNLTLMQLGRAVLRQTLTLFKLTALFLRIKKRNARCLLSGKIPSPVLFQRSNKLFRRILPCSVSEHAAQSQSRAVGDDNLRSCRVYDILFREMQSFGKYFHQRRMERQRSPFKSHRFLYIKPLRETADGLLRNGVKRRKRQIRLRHSLIEKRLNVRLCIHAAAP